MDPQSLRIRLASAWTAPRRTQFYRLVSEELIPKIHRGLRPNFRTLSDEDLDDCIGQALEAYIRRDNATISNPEAYIWTSAGNQARDLVEQRARVREVEEISDGGYLPDGIDDAMAVVLIEGLVEEVEASASWAVKVVQIAVSRLRPALKRTVLHLLVHGTDCEAASAAEVLGTTPATFRANKSNAYTALRSIIPIVIAENGIVPPTPRLVEVFGETHQYGEES